MNCVILHPKETTRNSSIPTIKKLPTAEELKPILRRSTSPEYIGAWKWGSLQIHLFGFKTGKTGTENKHELLSPFDTVVLFGEAILVATKQDDLVPFTTNDYKKFYNESSAGNDGDGRDGERDREREREREGDEDSEEVDDEEEDLEEDDDEVSEKEEVIEEEEEVVPIAVPKTVVKPKRGNRKLPIWFTYNELEPEPYTM